MTLEAELSHLTLPESRNVPPTPSLWGWKAHGFRMAREMICSLSLAGGSIELLSLSVSCWPRLPSRGFLQLSLSWSLSTCCRVPPGSGNKASVHLWGWRSPSDTCTSLWF